MHMEGKVFSVSTYAKHDINKEEAGKRTGKQQPQPNRINRDVRRVTEQDTCDSCYWKQGPYKRHRAGIITAHERLCYPSDPWLHIVQVQLD